MAEESLESKVQLLEKSLELLRDEMDRKLSIMERILTTRNEQFVVHKKLIEEEQALYEAVMTNWKCMSDSTGLSNYLGTKQSQGVDENRQCTSAEKRRSTSNRTRLKAKRIRNDSCLGGLKTERAESIVAEASLDWEEETACTTSEEESDTDVEANSGLESDDGGEHDALATSGMEKRVFVNYYCAEGEPNPEESSNDPVWIHFLREEKGTAALCKHCDERGFQQIYKLKSPSLGLLRRHLKQKHKIIVELLLPPPIENAEASTGKNQSPRKTIFLRHVDHLYTRYASKNSNEYWRCRDRTCGGKVQRRNGSIVETAEHACLTTAADCDAILFREKIREVAQSNPTLSTSEVIAAAKEGCPDDVIDLIPTESLRRTIRRIRQTLQTAAEQGAFEWTSKGEQY